MIFAWKLWLESSWIWWNLGWKMEANGEGFWWRWDTSKWRRRIRKSKFLFFHLYIIHFIWCQFLIRQHKLAYIILSSSHIMLKSSLCHDYVMLMSCLCHPLTLVKMLTFWPEQIYSPGKLIKSYLGSKHFSDVFSGHFWHVMHKYDLFQ